MNTFQSTRARGSAVAHLPQREHAPEVVSVALELLWRRYRYEDDERARDRLVVTYAPLVKAVAGRMCAQLPSHIDEADLISSGFTGLMAAIERFDPRRYVKFETFAAPRIRGAILDELRSVDWVPRSVRAHARAIERASVKLEQDLRRTPTDSELADEVGISAGELRSVFAALSSGMMLTLNGLSAVSDRSGDEVALIDTLADADTPDPFDVLAAADLREAIGGALDRLPERERMVVGMRHYMDLNMREIGEIIGVGESRVSQLHTKAMLRMRGWLAEAAVEEDCLAMAA